jgi:endonuclease III
MKIKRSFKRASEICNILVNAYKKKEGIYARNDIFPEFKPDEMSNADYSQYLFYGNVVNYNADAKILFKNLRECGFKFTTDNILENHSELEKVLKLRFPEEGLRRIINAAKDVKERYHGNPLNLLRKDLKKTYADIESIHGYGHKLARMIVILYKKHGFYHPENESDIEGAVDLHTVRISVNTKMIEVKDKKEIYKTSIVEPIAEFFKIVCGQNNLSGFELHESIWALGSTLCNDAVKKSDETACKTSCPIERYCEKDIYTARKYADNKRANGNFLVNRGKMRKLALDFR